MYSSRIAQHILDRIVSIHLSTNRQTDHSNAPSIIYCINGSSRPFVINSPLFTGIFSFTGSPAPSRLPFKVALPNLSRLRASVATAACSCFALAASIAPAATGLGPPSCSTTRPFVTLPLPWPIAGTQLVLGATTNAQRQPRSLRRTPNCLRQRCCTRARYPSEPIRGGASRTGFSGRSSITTA